MRTGWLCLAAMLMAGCVVGCDRSEPAPPAAGSAADRLKQDVQRVGQDLNAVAHQAATQAQPAIDEAKARLQRAADEARPALERAKEQAREATHEAATRVARETAPPAATQPQ